MSPTQLSAAVVAANVRPTPRSMLPAPDPAAASGEVGAGPLGEAPDVMAVLADPAGRFAVVLEGPDRAGRAAPSVYWRDLAGPFVLVVETTDGLELEALATLNDVALWLDGVLMLTALPASTSDHRFELSLAGYAALLALADAVEETRLRRQLERVTGPAPTLTVADVEAAFAAALRHDHPDWAVSAARAVCPSDLAAAEPQLADGLRELADAAIVRVAGDEVGITSGGVGLVATVGRPVRTVGVARAASATDDTIGVAHITVHRGVSGIWIAIWTALGDQPSCALVQCSAARAATLLVDLIRNVE